MSLFVNLLLGSVLAVLLMFAALRGRVVLMQGLREAAVDFLRLLPRLALGVIGSGFIAETVPQGLIVQWLGPESGVLGLGVATVAGALTPGGPVVGFAIGAAALKGGAAMPQVIAYATAWALTGGTFSLLTIQIAFEVNGDISFDPSKASALSLILAVIMALSILASQLLRNLFISPTSQQTGKLGVCS